MAFERPLSPASSIRRQYGLDFALNGSFAPEAANLPSALLTPCGNSEGVEFNPCGPPQLPPQKYRNPRGRNSFRIDLVPQRRFTMPVTEMKDHVYKILELVGSSEKSIEDAIQNAITRASKTIREMKWFEVVQTRGHIEKGSVRHYQVTLRVGFTLE
jgi:dodecin